MAKRKAFKREVVKDAANALAIGAVGAATALTPQYAVAGAVVGGAANLLGLVASWRATRVSRRWETFSRAYFEGIDESDPARVEAMLHAHAEKPEVQEVVIEGARAIEDVLSDAVVPVIARLTRTYQMNGSGGDWFFRGMRRTLSDLNEAEFSDFKRVVLAVAERLPDDLERLFVTRGIYADRLPRLRFLLSPMVPLPSPRDELFVEDVRSAMRLLHLLETNGLASPEVSGATYGTSDGAHWSAFLALESATMRRIGFLLTPRE